MAFATQFKLWDFNAFAIEIEVVARDLATVDTAKFSKSRRTKLRDLLPLKKGAEKSSAIRSSGAMRQLLPTQSN
ncbi:hypothetical protein F441_19808 [Phytophthora nicotianae CJ01A1]|uniref:Uncharacterized protein n=5 Tax=Phytophthora nicotianae TaxID=4792 RepID=W2PIJ2_PHYN3|nr:hypothetical protein PPTG_24215 [Phytophthora nicotianae INRA-310]ETI33360.1 hypothetical protein F443_19948 [Phytophthora nicotianae P1569]ETK73679.1 hypothetical protein L915_19441 [Phytophthora nicotianae]ETO62117.1 hypothetical protein F444_19940 [Phytophthora nicotianae P1976]ETP03203.1 hypothetical protein F441_19808 [Phytophthora nicotianae CJ01A1]ETL27122.1 hypothetical protein L916_19300 [Phytophthora nicotianae]